MPAVSKMDSSEMRQRLATQHGEAAPETWSRTQLLLRMVELEGEDCLNETKMAPSPLRLMEIEINKCARKKSVLQDLLTMRLGVKLTGCETIDQLRIKGMEAAYRVCPGHPTDHMGFGMHADKTYAEAMTQFPDYAQWALTTVRRARSARS